MVIPFQNLAKRLADSGGAAWARDALRFTPVNLDAYELIFTQVGLVMPASLRSSLGEHGAFELAAIRDEDDEDEDEDADEDDEDSVRGVLQDMHGDGWAGRDVLSSGLHLLSPGELFQTFQSQRAGATADPKLGSLWIFAAPHGYLWTEAFAFDVRFRVGTEYACIPFHEDDIGEQLDLAGDGPLRHAAPTLDAWARWLTDEIVRAVEALGPRSFAAAPPHEKAPLALERYLAEAAAGKPWSTWVEGIWREALHRAPPEVARQVLADVGTLVTRPAERDYNLPDAADLLHRLPESGHHARRMGLLEMWGPRRPDRGELQVACDYLEVHAHEAAPAPRELLEQLVAVAWRDRGPPETIDVAWARALLLALGTPDPAQLFEAARLVLAPGDSRRGVFETMWLRLEPFARTAGVL